jgi:hypothetical protein
MFFILQKERTNYNNLDIDILTLKQELDKQRYQHEYTYMSINDFDPNIKGYSIKNIDEAIPIGSIDFVGAFLKKFHNVENMNPIEVPNELRLDKFLNRKYSIIESSEIPKKGYYFFKDVSKLKNITYTGNMEYLLYDGIFDKPKGKLDTSLHLDKNHLYQVSEVKKILSEYRVFVFEDKFKGIQYYDGDPLVMPTPNELEKLQEMVNRYMLNPTRPKAYSLDIAIIKHNNEYGRDIMILECHPFSSLGLYGVNGSFLPLAYRHGVDWYIKHNTPIEKFKN